MTQAAAVLAMLVTVASAVAGTRMRRVEGLALVAATSGVVLVALQLLGADGEAAFAAAPRLLLVLGYAALADVLAESGVASAAARRLPPSPVWVMLLAALASVFLSNDVVVVAFAPVVLSRRSRVVDAAALFVGANVSGGLLPQGSPTNLLLLGDRPFWSYLQLSWAVSVAMVAAAVVALPLAVRATRRWSSATGAAAPAAAAPERFTGQQRRLVVLAVGAVAAQPAADALGMPRPALGVVLLVVAAVAGRHCHLDPRHVVAMAPWQLVPLVLVLAAGASLLGGDGSAPHGTVGFAATAFLVAAGGTDILSASLAAPVVAATHALGPAALVAVTAGACATPVAAVAGLLLRDEHRQAEVRPRLVTFCVAAAVSVACFAAGTAAAVAS